ncbi:TPA: hypothetical protein HMU07_24305 [Escherichia coli]|nr:hypothetical protein [Escherichia coli]
MAPDITTGRDPPQRREARFAKRRCALHPGGLLPGCQERRPRRGQTSIYPPACPESSGTQTNNHRRDIGISKCAARQLLADVRKR